MNELVEVRIFRDQFEMMDDYDKFCKAVALQFHVRELSARWNDGFYDWRTYWTTEKRGLDALYGRSCSKIMIDVDCSKEVMRYAMTRMRGEVVHDICLFHKVIR